MDSTTRFQPPPRADPPQYLARRDALRFKIWLGTGLLIEYCVLASIVHATISRRIWHTVVMSTFFLPVCPKRQVSLSTLTLTRLA
jgi:hypothetical protein